MSAGDEGIAAGSSPETDRERLERLDREEAAAPVDAGSWDKPPENEELTEPYWKDPEPDFQGMLSADRIRGYHYGVGRMIRPFQEDKLKPAAYELTLGPRCIVEGKTRTLTPEDPLLEIPPNSIVFVSMREMLLLPHWLAGRFDLAIDFIYKGLLLGTGPQVDPGFRGVLSCPLHNISNSVITLQYLEPFAKIDFVKTSFGKVELPPLQDEDELFSRIEAKSLLGYQAEHLKLWKRSKNYRPAILFASGVNGVKSSVHDLEDEVSKVRKEVDNRITQFANKLRFGEVAAIFTTLIAIISVVGVIIALASYLTSYTDGRVEDVRDAPELVQLRQQTAALSRELEEAKTKEQQLSNRFRELAEETQSHP
jgi:deoxycytidine triphosphate deaminase